MTIEFVAVIPARLHFRARARSVPCPKCKADIGRVCRTAGGWARKEEHPARIALAEKTRR